MHRGLVIGAVALTTAAGGATVAFGGGAGLIFDDGHYVRPGPLDDGKQLLPHTKISLAEAIATGAGTPINPWFPLRPGTTFVYQGSKDGEPTRDVVTVTQRTKIIQGFRCTVVSDLLYERGRLTERTSDWYRTDAQGNVWYMGEATAELDGKGRVTSREGSWQAGVDGARAGILMPARPKVGQTFQPEFYKGHAEDHLQVLSLSATVRVPYTKSTHALLTKEWTPLEPGVVDHKLYVRGVGLVKEQTVRRGSESAVLVSVKRP